MAGASIFDIIVSKFHYEKKPYPIILLQVDRDLEVGSYYAILPFGLIVHLWVKSSRESLFDAKKIT